ncbi:zinc ribbon domain-containing protein [Periweissella cryptocerci]|uniref:Zinc ribbon domain-containing protein n=1 Tax=Periweissella cryptocerci TaxID=2506420 RepID=A0A4P6YTK4_9LACO|nr:zinc ribbon domain-containing protein [Periweissella cryptocerci]QBO36084.1 zinc ribbon domain-containing protein [Periweissella cryptocerci]
MSELYATKCPICDTPIRPTDEFCPKCGFNLKRDISVNEKRDLQMEYAKQPHRSSYRWLMPTIIGGIIILSMAGILLRPIYITERAQMPKDDNNIPIKDTSSQSAATTMSGENFAATKKIKNTAVDMQISFLTGDKYHAEIKTTQLNGSTQFTIEEGNYQLKDTKVVLAPIRGLMTTANQAGTVKSATALGYTQATQAKTEGYKEIKHFKVVKDALTTEFMSKNVTLTSVLTPRGYTDIATMAMKADDDLIKKDADNMQTKDQKQAAELNVIEKKLTADQNHILAYMYYLQVSGEGFKKYEKVQQNTTFYAESIGPNRWAILKQQNQPALVQVNYEYENGHYTFLMNHDIGPQSPASLVELYHRFYETPKYRKVYDVLQKEWRDY